MVVDTPAPLAGMPHPRPHMPWQALADIGIRYVICLATPSPDYRPDPLQIVFAAELEDLFKGDPPLDPMREERLIREAVQISVTKLRGGEGVVIHCAGGRGRTGSVIGCTLRALGYPAAEVIHYLDEIHRARGKDGWPEAAWQAELVRLFSG